MYIREHYGADLVELVDAKQAHTERQLHRSLAKKRHSTTCNAVKINTDREFAKKDYVPQRGPRPEEYKYYSTRDLVKEEVLGRDRSVNRAIQATHDRPPAHDSSQESTTAATSQYGGFHLSKK